MTRRLVSVGVLLAGLLAVPLTAAEPPSAQRLWEQGQDAMRDGRTDVAVGFYERSLALDPKLVNNHLSLAAAYIDKGEDEKALPHLAQYIAAKPNHVAVRAHYAELLFRLREYQDAAAQYDRFDADLQEHEGTAQQELIHCHSRLMEVAEQQQDGYGEHLHRGIGLYLLARQSEEALPNEEDFSSESLLCKAAGELTLARRQRPDEARPCWYLFAVWSQLAQRQPAARWLRAAEETAAFSYLTPKERRNLELAVQEQFLESERK